MHCIFALLPAILLLLHLFSLHPETCAVNEQAAELLRKENRFTKVEQFQLASKTILVAETFRLGGKLAPSPALPRVEGASQSRTRGGKRDTFIYGFQLPNSWSNFDRRAKA